MTPLAVFVLAMTWAWGHRLSWLDVILAIAFYAVSGHGVTIGYHRYFTHGSFKATKPFRLALAVAGSLAIEGGLIEWVATHRRHHRFSDGPGDPHSPYRYGQGLLGQLRGLLHAHIGWMVTSQSTDAQEYAPDLLADRGLRLIDRLFPGLAAVSLLAPFLLGWAVSGRVAGAVSALLWAGFARVALLHHVTWSINSICHVFGRRPFKTRRTDRASNFWPLAVLSMGESWHNLHHADPSCARHGVDRFQLDTSARLIRWFEKLGWVHDVRWPNRVRLELRRVVQGPAGRPAEPCTTAD